MTPPSFLPLKPWFRRFRSSRRSKKPAVHNLFPKYQRFRKKERSFHCRVPEFLLLYIPRIGSFLLAAPLWNGSTLFRSCWSTGLLQSTLPAWNGLPKSSLYHQWKANGIVVSLRTGEQSGCVTLSRQEKVRSGVWFLPRFPASLIHLATKPEWRFYQSN